MEKSFDLAVKETRDKVVKTFNESGLPITVIAMMVRELSAVVNADEQNSILSQQIEYDSKLKEEDENANNK